jgi:hypothetical protein
MNGQRRGSIEQKRHSGGVERFIYFRNDLQGEILVQMVQLRINTFTSRPR